MGFSLKPGLQQAVTAYDPTVEILWNNRIHRWVVACFGGGMHNIARSLRGVVRITGEKTHLTPIFVCEFDPPNVTKCEPGEGIPAEPDMWIIGMLKDLRSAKHQTPAEYDKRVKAEEQAQEAERQRLVSDVSDNFSTEMLRYGKRGDDGRSKRNIVITGNEGWKPEEATTK